ncbi:hypothetical protein [Pseudorhodoferax soli]|uniref:hypothetical protein n=1 Tax=Pseudorhodoferax soli TaxID=545864 RepID=UPI0011C05DE3|nr:hypothetical protein [Pseudorhodoferax soli]
MEHAYKKKHVQVSVAAATGFGMLFGFWLGKRSGDAGFIEATVVWLSFFVLSSYVFSRIDKKHLPEEQ